MQNNADNEIGGWRKKIDEIDGQLLELFNRRASYALEIGKIKGLNDIPVHCPIREAQIFSHVRDSNPGPLSHGAISRLFERIIDETRRLEREQTEGSKDGH